MRSALIALLAFAAGIALMLAWGMLPAGQRSPLHTRDRALTAVGGNSGAALAEPADEDVDDTDRWPTDAPTPEQVMGAQPQLLRAALRQLSPRVAGKPNLYLLAFAGDGAEDVFHNEAEYAAQLFTRRFGPTAHALVLENYPGTLATQPLADWSNLESALDGLARVIRPADILVLYLTTHGSEDHTLLVDMDPLPLDQIGAEDLGAILKAHPFRWKVVVVNACYAGGFVPGVRGAGTLVITAARSDRSSFGCGSDADATYFGKAWLVDALNHTDNFAAAFQLASREIASWEQQDKLTPSEPQIDIGSGIAAQLALWRKGIAPGPQVPFKPAAPAGVHVDTLTGSTTTAGLSGGPHRVRPQVAKDVATLAVASMAQARRKSNGKTPANPRRAKSPRAPRLVVYDHKRMTIAFGRDSANPWCAALRRSVPQTIRDLCAGVGARGVVRTHASERRGLSRRNRSAHRTCSSEGGRYSVVWPITHWGTLKRDATRDAKHQAHNRASGRWRHGCGAGRRYGRNALAQH